MQYSYTFWKMPHLWKRYFLLTLQTFNRYGYKNYTPSQTFFKQFEKVQNILNENYILVAAS